MKNSQLLETRSEMITELDALMTRQIWLYENVIYGDNDTYGYDFAKAEIKELNEGIQDLNLAIESIEKEIGIWDELEALSLH